MQLPVMKPVKHYLIICLAAIFKNNNKIQFHLKDITQACIQLISKLNRDFHIWLFSRLISL